MEKASKVFSRFGFAQIAGALLVLVFGLVMAPLLTPAVLTGIINSVGPSLLLLLTYVPNVLTLIVFWLIIRKIPKAEWKKESMSFGRLLRIYLIMYCVATALNGLGTVISGASPAGGTEQLDLIESVVNTKLVVGFLIPALIGPVVEELFFRKLMIDRLHNYGETTVIVFTSLCFGLFHGNLTQFLYATTVGLFLGYVYCKTGKVLYTMIMHILLNTFSSSIMLLIPFLSAGREDESRKVLVVLVGVALFLLIVVMMVAGLILGIKHLKRKDVVLDDETPDAIPKNLVLKTVYLNPGVLLLFLYGIFGIVTSLFKIQLPF